MAWQVDLLFCGVVMESYWYSDERQLLAIQSQGTQSLMARRVASAKIAATPMISKAPPRPAASTRDSRHPL
jgi:hypothetical protein